MLIRQTVSNPGHPILWEKDLKVTNEEGALFWVRDHQPPEVFAKPRWAPTLGSWLLNLTFTTHKGNTIFSLFIKNGTTWCGHINRFQKQWQFIWGRGVINYREPLRGIQFTPHRDSLSIKKKSCFKKNHKICWLCLPNICPQNLLLNSQTLKDQKSFVKN